MFTRPPELSDERVVAALAEGWGVRCSELAYAPLGFGSHHWHAVADGGRWFVTIDDLADAHRTRLDALERLVAALGTARQLHDAGLTFVVAPRPTQVRGVVHVVDDRFVAAMYPHINGSTHVYSPFPTHQARLAVLERLVAVHCSPVGDAPAHTDHFQIDGRDGLRAALGSLDHLWQTGPFAEPLRRLLTEHSTALVGALYRYDTVAAEAAASTSPLVITHGEPHRGNTIDTVHGVLLVDWDTLLLAPPERDLWQLVGEDPAMAAEYTARTGVAVSDDVLQLYRTRWALTDIALYATLLSESHVRSADTLAAWENLSSYFTDTNW